MIEVEGREFAYLECLDPEGFFKKDFSAIGTHAGSPLPVSGGMITEEAAVRLPDGRLMCAVSYRGDIEGWRRVVTEWCRNRAILFGVVQGGNIVLDNGERHALSKCEPIFIRSGRGPKKKK
jgi:hypothetical protein